MFMADLVRAIPRELTCDFLGVRSYGDATVSSGVVEITSDLGAPIAGRQVLLVEDIADTGLTLRYLHDLLAARGPAAVHVCVLLAKPTLPRERRAPRSTSSASTPRTPTSSATAWTPGSSTGTFPTSPRSTLTAAWPRPGARTRAAPSSGGRAPP